MFPVDGFWRVLQHHPGAKALCFPLLPFAVASLKVELHGITVNLHIGQCGSLDLGHARSNATDPAGGVGHGRGMQKAVLCSNLSPVSWISPLSNLTRLHKIIHDDICVVAVVVFLLHSVFSCFLIASGWICLNQTQLGISAFLLVKGLQSAKTESFSWGATLRPWRRCSKKRRRGNWETCMSDRLHRASQKDWVATSRLFKVRGGTCFLDIECYCLVLDRNAPGEIIWNYDILWLNDCQANTNSKKFRYCLTMLDLLNFFDRWRSQTQRSKDSKKWWSWQSRADQGNYWSTGVPGP